MEVIVQDANNIVIEVDQGRQGRGVEDVSLITVGADYYLLFTFTDGTTEQVGPIATTVTEVISAEVRNAEAVTILKGQPVYLYQAQGNLATVKLAYNTSDATSAKTLGLAAENIAPNAQGLITCQGTLGGLNTAAYNEGDTLYLGATAGTLTNVKPQAPNHLVYIGVVERANAGAGQIYVRVQNGFELDEIHDVRIVSPVNGNTLIYDASTSLWKNAGITAGSGVSVTNGPASITVGNTGVLSLSGGTTGLTPATATTGAVTLAGTLGIANGGTGQTTANAALNALLPAQTSQSGKYLKTDGSNAAWDQLDISTADITGTLPIANGGTGQSTANAGLNALLPSQTSQSGKYLKTDGTNASWDQLDISTADITGTLPVANGGTGVTTSTGTGSVVLSNSPALTTPNLGTPSAVTLTNATGLPLSTGVTGTLATTNGGTGLTSFTANGVVYASSSSALTTGSALTFDGTNFTTTGYAAGNGLRSFGGNAVRFYNAANTNWAQISAPAGTGDMQFDTGAGEQMRLTSTGLGIGNSSPTEKLDVTGNFKLSGTATLSGGTANGVLYLNGSKVATSGAALAFNGTSLLVGKNSSDANNWGVQNYATNAFGSGMQLTYGGVGSAGLWVPAASSLAFGADAGSGTTELMRLTSTGLGIGTSSPTNRLTVAAPNAKQNIVSTTGTNEVVLFLQNTGGDFYIGRENSAGTYFSAPAYSANLYSVGTYPMLFWTNSTERMRLDSSGNLGLGVVPSYRLHVQGTPSQQLVLQSIDTNSTGKEGTVNVRHYTNTEEPQLIVGGYSESTNNYVYVGGGFAGSNAATQILFYTAANTTTTVGSERMRLDSSGNLGIGTSSPGYKLDVSASVVNQAIARLNNSDTNDGNGLYIKAGGVNAGKYALYVENGSGTALLNLLASGNLGIGTSSPASKLDVYGAISISGIEAIRNRVFAYSGSYSATQVGSPSSNNGNVALAVDVNSVAGGGFAGSNQVILPNNGALFVNAAGSDFIGAIRRDSSNRILIGPNTSSGLTFGDLVIDTSGNLGLGVTPSAWATTNIKAIQLGTWSAFYQNGSGYPEISFNSYQTGGSTWAYLTSSNPATRFSQTNGAFQWFTASSGTAGNAISFTQAMTLSNTSGPALRVGVTADLAGFNFQAANQVGFSVHNSGSSATAAYFSAANNVTLTSAGNFAVINGIDGILFGAAATESARITSGGELLVGTTNASVGTAVGCRIVDSGARLEVAKDASTNADVGLSQYSTGAAAYRFYVGYGGTVYATSTTITAISDQRLKENIRDLDAGLSEIMALKPRKFDWKAGKGKDKKNDCGWIAQEFEQVFPDMVDIWQDPAPEGEEPYKAVNADLIPVLVKAIQEQQALITALTARVAALEGV